MPTGVTVVAEQVDSGERFTERASYLVGCDGPRSVVRQGLGIRYAGESGVVRDFFGGRMHAIFLRMPDFYQRVPASKGVDVLGLQPPAAQFHGLRRRPRERFAFHTQLKPGDPEEPDEAAARRMFAEGVWRREPRWRSSRTPIGRRALPWLPSVSPRAGFCSPAMRCICSPPAGGLGYNTAIEDAVNLGWKLAGPHQGVGRTRPAGQL